MSSVGRGVPRDHEMLGYVYMCVRTHWGASVGSVAGGGLLYFLLDLGLRDK